MSIFKISRSKDTSVLNLLCHEALDPYDEPVPKIQKLSHKDVDFVAITAKDMEVFFNLLEDEIIAAFLEYDKFCCLADKYLIAMVMTYFKRAGLSFEKYNVYNFFVALHLAHDMEEDYEDMKYDLVRWFFGSNWEDEHNRMLIKRDELWMSMNYRGLVSKKCCEEVVAMAPEHPIWQRQRKEIFGGARRDSSFKWSPKISVPGSPGLPTSSLGYGSGSDDENYSLSSIAREILAETDMKSYVINGWGRMKCVNENDDYSKSTYSESANKKFKATFSYYEE